MKLEQLYSIIPDSAVIRVLSDGEEIARYDGRNSIPEYLNDKTVLRLDMEDGIAVTVKATRQRGNLNTLYRVIRREKAKIAHFEKDTWANEEGRQEVLRLHRDILEDCIADYSAWGGKRSV